MTPKQQIEELGMTNALLEADLVKAEKIIARQWAALTQIEEALSDDTTERTQRINTIISAAIGELKRLPACPSCGGKQTIQSPAITTRWLCIPCNQLFDVQEVPANA
jgi:hypothetical protein